MKPSRDLQQAARISRDAEALASGKPDRILRRVKNHVVGRAIARAGFWRALWR